MKVTVETEIDIDDFVSENKYDVIDSLESENYYVFEHKTLDDRYKLDWFKENWDNVSLEQLESLIP